MPIRPRIPRVQPARELTRYDHVQIFCRALNRDFAQTPFGYAFPSRAAAQRVWPGSRAAVWSATRRQRVPVAAQQFDGFTCRGADLLRHRWNRDDFLLNDVRAALADDRQAVEQFERRDPEAASAIAVCLLELREDLQTLEGIAHLRRRSGSELFRRRSSPTSTSTILGRFSALEHRRQHKNSKAC